MPLCLGHLSPFPGALSFLHVFVFFKTWAPFWHRIDIGIYISLGFVAGMTNPPRIVIAIIVLGKIMTFNTRHYARFALLASFHPRLLLSDCL